MDSEIAKWRAVGEGPIRSDAPAGESARYDPLFEKLQAEINKMEALSGGQVRWKEVVELSGEILQGKSKDLLVAGYLCVGLLEEKGYAGLLAGLSCMEGIIETFWETLYPEAARMRGRINAIFWLAEKGGTVVARKSPLGGDAKAIRACGQKIESLEKLLSERIGGDSPGLGDLRRGIEERSREAEADEKAAAPSEPASSAASTSDGAAGPSVLGKIESPDDVETALAQAGDLIFRAAAFVRNQEPSNPWPYRVSRALAWARLDEAPPNTEGETRIPPPPSHLAEGARLLVENGGWKDLLDHAEAQFAEYPLWLDPHRFSALALSNLGPSYAAARNSVIGEFLALLRRVPDLLRCRFDDGTPFANDETQSWVEQQKGATQNGARSDSAQAAALETGRIDEIQKNAAVLLGKGRTKEAIALLQEKASETGARRDRFLLRLALAKLCFQAGLPKVAASQLDGLAKETEGILLDEWEPKLSLDLLRTHWKVLNRLLEESGEGSPERVRQAETVQARISRLDPVSALELERK